MTCSVVMRQAHLSKTEILVVHSNSVMDSSVKFPSPSGPMRTAGPVPSQIDATAAEGGMDLPMGDDGMARRLSPSCIRLQDQTSSPQLPPCVPVRRHLPSSIWSKLRQWLESHCRDLQGNRNLPVVERLCQVKACASADRKQILFVDGGRAELPYLQTVLRWSYL